MDKFWNFVIAMFVIAGIFYLVVGITVVDYAQEKSTEIDTTEQLIGEKIIVRNDTLDIVDYSVLTNTLILSDGTRVNVKFAEKKILTEEDYD
jgi:hypothetical protein